MEYTEHKAENRTAENRKNPGTWLITGCSSGLGRNMAKAFLEKGEQVVVTARRLETIEDLGREFPETALCLPLDVTDPEAVEKAVQAAYERFGLIDVLVNNAGYGYRAAVEEGIEEDVQKLFDTCFFGPVRMMKAVLPHMRAKKSGVIVNVSSIAVEYTMPGSGYYSAAKHALEGLSDGLRRETEPLGIRVMVVEPGAFRTDFAGRSLTQSVKEIADYAPTAGTRRIGADKTHGTQPGDPYRAAQVIYQAVTSEKPPFRLVLGRDAVEVMEEALKARKEELDRWKAYSSQTDFQKG